MKNKNATVAEQNRKLDECLNLGDYEKADEISRELCLLQGLEPADKMPDNFLFLLKKRSKQKMKHKKKSPKYFTKIAAAAAGILLIGTTAGATAIHRNNVSVFPNGLSSEALSAETQSDEKQPSFEGIDLPQTETKTQIIEQESPTVKYAWLEKKVWDETSTDYESDDRINWTPREVTVRVTEYRYADYGSAAKHSGFINAFTKNYSGEAFYREYEHLTEEAKYEAAAGEPMEIKDYSITADFTAGSGRFTLEQQKTQTWEDDGSDNSFFVITGDTGNERSYAASTGYEYKLSDDNETGKNRTTVIVPGSEYQLILTFTDMTEAEIYSVLESVNIKSFVNMQ